MTYREVWQIMNEPGRYSYGKQLEAVSNYKKLSMKAFRYMYIWECAREIIKSLCVLAMWVGGVSATIISFLMLAYNTTSETPLALNKVLQLFLVMFMGIICAYSGYEIMKSRERERYRNGKGKTARG